MSNICSCNKSGELIWTTNNCRMFDKHNQIVHNQQTQFNLTDTGIHFIHYQDNGTSRSRKLIQCYHHDQIICCSLITNNNDNNDHNQLQQIDQNDQKNMIKNRRSFLIGNCCTKNMNNDLLLDDNQIVIELDVFENYKNNRRRFKRNENDNNNSASNNNNYNVDNRLKKRKVLFLIEKSMNFNENLQEAMTIKDKLDTFINNGHVQKHSKTKPLLIIINPISGKGKAMKLFEKYVKEMLINFNINYYLLITKYPKHATDFIKNHANIDDSYSAIVTISGDGLLYEVVNGFVQSIEQSTNATKRISIPISIIPGGSGNGLASTLNRIYSNENNQLMFSELIESTLHTIKGQPQSMDLIRITTITNKIYYSFLSFGWGLMADIDIESERLRFLGESRFSLWAIYRSLALKRYHGQLSYLPINCNASDIPPINKSLNNEWITIENEFVLVYCAYSSYLSSSVKFAPESQLNDQIIYLLYILGNVSSFQIIQFLLGLENGTHIKLPFVNFIKCKAFRFKPTNTTDIMTIDGELIPCEQVQGEIMANLASILLRKNPLSSSAATNNFS